MKKSPLERELPSPVHGQQSECSNDIIEYICNLVAKSAAIRDSCCYDNDECKNKCVLDNALSFFAHRAEIAYLYILDNLFRYDSPLGLRLLK